MKVVGKTIHEVRLEHHPVANASMHWTSRDALLLELEDEAGRTAFGEAAPLVGYSPDSIDDALRALEAIVVPFHLDTPRDLDGSAPTRSPTARFAFESAIYGLFREATGTSLESLLGGAPREIALSTLVEDPSSAAKAVRDGFATVKVKVGRDPITDAENLLAIRRAVGPDVRIRADANRAFSVDAALELARRVAPAKLELIEELVPIEDLPKLRGIDIPLALDESLAAVDTVDRLGDLAKVGVSAVILKPALLGGLHAAKRVAAAAAAAEMVVLISHMFGGPGELSTGRALAAVVGSPDHAHGLAPHGALAAWPRPNPR